MYTMSNIKNLSLKIVLAEKNTITASQPTNYQKFPYVKLFYVTSGDVSLVMKETTEKLSKDQLILLNPNVEYYWDLTGDKAAEIIEVGIHGLEFSKVGDAESDFSYYRHNDGEKETATFLNLLLDEMSTRNQGYEEVSKRFVEIILIHLLRLKEFSIRNSLNKKNHKEIQTVKNYMKVNYHKNITLDDLVDLVHINKFYLIRIFKQEVCMSPIDYLIHIRIDEAQKMLRNTNIAIADIAHLVGFQSPSHFSKTFRELSNCTPSQYRRQGNQ